VPFKTTDVFPVFKYAAAPATRQRALEAYEARLAVNAPILARVLDLRRRIASLLGYPTWADYITEEKMVGSAKNAMDVSTSSLFPPSARTPTSFSF
jgi:Zn-dependent oligopeptidase